MISGGRSARGAFVSRELARRYPPLFVIGIALILALFTLPSALNLPLANPGQTLEYAPVPGNGNSQAGGNFAGLGLGSESAAPDQNLLASLLGLPGGVGGNPSSKLCVGNPPRQTEDPLSPPCVAFFKGDNGGATYRGVSRSEITVIIYQDGAQAHAGCGANTQNPSDMYFDADAPYSASDNCMLQDVKTWQRYFNARFQTYNRHVHFYLYYSQQTLSDASKANSPSTRRANALDNIAKYHPFSVVSINVAGYVDSYQQTMNQNGVLFFNNGESDYTPQADMARYPGLFWEHFPSFEELAQNWASFICQKIVIPGRTTFSRSYQNQPRKYGLVYTTDDAFPTMQAFQKYVGSLVSSKCGVTYTDQAPYPVEEANVSYVATSPQRNASYNTYAAPEMTQFQREGITTIIWPGGSESNFSQAAAKLGYYPEWVLGGDGITDGNLTAYSEDQGEWAGAIVVTPHTWVGTRQAHVPPSCDDAWNSVGGDPANESYACDFFYDLFLEFFTGIQVAGPRLTPPAMDQGFHAIPPHRSVDATQPACYFDPGDYTCVKDGTAMWWDPTAQYDTQGYTKSGCWRMFDNGARYFSWKWPPADVTAQKHLNDVCNGLGGRFAINVDQRP